MYRAQGGLPEKPGMSAESFLKLCKKCGIRWAVFVRDATHTWYHRGVAAAPGEESARERIMFVLRVQNVSDRETVRYLSLDVVPHRGTDTFYREM